MLTLVALTDVPAATLKLPHPELSVCAKLAMRPVDVLVLKLKVLAPGNDGGLGGTSLPSTKFSCAIPSVTVVAVVNATALLTKYPELFAPIIIVLPTILVILASNAAI